MSVKCCAFVLVLLGLVSGVSSEEALKPEVADVETKQNAKPTLSSAAAARAECISQCESANGQCNSEVRRERQECSRQAATGGNNPFTGRPDGQTYYCGYFGADHCGMGRNRAGCTQRFSRRYSQCVEWMRGNVASRRFDCVRAETKAQSFCRAELQDCRKTCS